MPCTVVRSPRGGWGAVTWQPSPRGWWGTVFPGVGNDKGGGYVFVSVLYGFCVCRQSVLVQLWGREGTEAVQLWCKEGTEAVHLWCREGTEYNEKCSGERKRMEVNGGDREKHGAQ